jgi:hypothetical protein
VIFYLINQIQWLNPVICLIGLVVCICAYKNCRKCGYLILAIYFLLVSINLIFGQAIHGILAEHSRNKTPLSSEAEKQYQQEITALNQKYFSSGRGIIYYKVNFPLYSIILVAGVWSLAKRDSKKLTN